VSLAGAADPALTPVSADELGFVRATVERLRLDPEDLRAEQFVALREDGRIAAFGRVRPHAETAELADVAVLEPARGRGLGARIVRELVRRFPQDEVFLTTDRPAWFERLGFLRTQILPPEIAAKLGGVCARLRPGAVGMLYDRRVERLPTLADCYRAKRALAPRLARTPLVHSPALSAALGCEAHLKLESLQPTGAFKVRGGVYLAAQLDAQARRAGVVGASTGNHGQSLAFGAKLFGVRCLIAVPRGANPLKVAAMRALGAEVVEEGADFEEARAHAEARARREGLRYVHHANTPELVAGVSTLSLEILEDLPDVEAIFAPIGGGSGMLGHCLVAKALKPDLVLVGVQAQGAPAVYRSWRERTLQRAPIATAAEGLATGEAFFPAVKTFLERLDEIALVSDAEMQRAIALLARTARIVAEDAGAAGVAAARQLAERIRGRKVAFVISGGNLQPERLRQALEAHGGDG
jgi:threonine dehydratase